MLTGSVGPEIEALRQHLDGQLDEVRKHAFKTRPVDTLCHYTSLEGLVGILESRRL